MSFANRAFLGSRGLFGRTGGPASKNAANDDERGVIFVHGSLASGGMWKPYVRALEPGFAIHTPDLVGYGRNPAWPQDLPFRLADEVKDFAGRIDGVCEPFDIVAHSYGGAMALRFAWEHFDRVRSLTLIEPTFFRVLADPRHDAETERAEIDAVANAVRDGVRLGEPEAAMCRFVEYWNGPGAWRALPDELKERFTVQAASVRGNFDAGAGDDMPLDDLRDLAIPTLMVSGSRSTAAARKTTAIIAGLLPRAETVEIADAGHMSPVTHPHILQPLIESWLKEGRVAPQLAA